MFPLIRTPKIVRITVRDILVIGIVLIVAFYAIPYIIPLFVPPAPPPPPEDYVGSISFTIYSRDSFITTNPRDVDLVLYRKVGEEYIGVLTGNGTASLTVDDKGRLYLALEDDANYVDVEMTKAGLGGYLEKTEFLDIDVDGYLEVVYTLHFTEENVKAPTGVTPSVNLVLYSFACDTALKFNSPSDITGIGTAPKDVWVNYQWIWGGSNRGIKVLRFYVYTNVTSEDEIRLVRVESVLGIFDRAKITFEGINKRWVIELPIVEANLWRALEVKYKEGMNPNFAYFNLLFRVDFDTSSAIEIKPAQEAIKPDHSTFVIKDPAEPVLLVKA